MQTAKISVGEVYAIKRGPAHQRFAVTEIVTKKTTSGTQTTIIGNVIDDGGTRGSELRLEPSDLFGPFAAFAELAEKAQREKEERERMLAEREAQALADRRALYRFIGETPPRNVKEYNQLFRVLYGGVEIGSEGRARLIEKIRTLVPADKRALDPTTQAE